MKNKEKKENGRRGAGRPSSEEAAKVADRLLDAAQELFIEKGFTATTMDEIARRAGSSTQTIYSRYPSKLDVLQAVTRRLAARPRVPAPEKASDINPRQFLVRFGQQAADTLAHGAGGINRLALAEAHRIPELRMVAALGFGRGVEYLRVAFGQWREDGVLDVPGDLDRASVLLNSMMTDRPRIRAVLGEPMSKEESNAYVEHAVDIFLHGCGKESPPT